MPITKYTKTIATDFQSAEVSSDTLTTEINADGTISPRVVDHIDTGGGDCDIYMDDALTGAQETALGMVCANHEDLATHRAKRKGALRLQMLGHISANFDAAKQLGFLMVMCKGLKNGWTNRKNKINAVFNWGENVMGEYYLRCDDVDAAADHAAVDAVAANYPSPPAQTVRNAKETVD